MIRTRLLKPRFFTDEDLLDLPIPTRLLFAGLWCLADREGRLEDRPRRIKIELFPCDDIDVGAALSALAEKGCVLRYEADGQKYIEIPGFKRHQHPHKNEATSVIPAPLATLPERSRHYQSTRANTNTNTNTNTKAEIDGSTPSTVTTGGATKAISISARQKALTLLEDKEFTEGLRKRFGFSPEDWEYQAEKWTDHVELKPPKANWKNSLRNWAENAVKFSQGAQNNRIQGNKGHAQRDEDDPFGLREAAEWQRRVRAGLPG